MPADQGGARKGAVHSQTLEPGDLFADRFRVEVLLGRGGMGAVYRVRDNLVDETLALKLLVRPAGPLAAIAADLFKREVRLARRITHPHVVRIHDLGERDAHLYLTMELVDGHDLRRDLEQRGRLEVPRAARICAAVASGLEAAHAAGIVHRDLKPENVLLNRAGRVLVSDFGIARAVSGDDASVGQRTGGVVGTLPYMAPEQLEGGAVGAAVDVYALGLLIFESVVGEPAFVGPTPFAAAVARLHGPPPNLRSRRSVPDALDDLVRRCMSRDPALRPLVGEVALELDAIAARIGTVAQGSAQALEQAWSASEVKVTDAETRPGGASDTAIGTLDPGAGVPHSLGPHGTAAGLGQVHRPAANASGRRLAMPLPATHASIAVLPLGYRGPPEHDWLGEAIAGELTDTLSRTRGLRVLGTSAVARALADRDPRRLCGELGIDHVVDGSMQVAGGRVRVTVRLLDFEGTQRWTERFDLHFGDLFELQERAARRIVEALRLELTAFTGTNGAPPEAVERYLRARSILRAQLLVRCPEAVLLLEEALALAPDFGPAQAAHAWASVLVWFFPEGAPPRDWAAVAETSVTRALAIAPECPESHLASARFCSHRGELGKAVGALRAALELAPTAADVHYIIGQLECETGRVDAGLARLALATELEPTATTYAYERARILALAGDRAAFRESLGHVFKHSPGLPPTHLMMREAAWARDEVALREVITIVPTQLTPQYAPFLVAVARGHLGEISAHDVARALRPLLEMPINARLRALVLTNLAEVECATGSYEESLATLRTLEQTLLYNLTWLERCRLLDPLRAREGFLEIVRATRRRCDDVWNQPSR